MLLFLSHVAVKIRGLCSVYMVYGAKAQNGYLVQKSQNKEEYYFPMVSSKNDDQLPS